MDQFLIGLQLVFAPDVMLAILLSAVYGMIVGSIPGLAATMAIALLVPITFYLSPIAALATIVTASAMAIFAGDIPSALLRLPGTPASAAYTDDAYLMSRRGEPEKSLGISLWFSALGGMIGTVALVIAAPALARVALNFSSFEYFWLTVLGLLCVSLVANSRPSKALASVCLGLLVACVGVNNPSGVPRFTFGVTNFLSGIEVVPALVGMFAVSEVMRALVTKEPPLPDRRKFGSILKGQWQLTKKYKVQAGRGSLTGIIIGILPGAGADIAAWASYAISKRFSKKPEQFGKGGEEGLIEAGAANNSAVSGAWVPALVFGIPGDTITAIAIGVLFMQGLNPGPTLFTQNASSMYALYIVFFIANILMIPLGVMVIRAYSGIVRLPRSVVMPVVLLFCAVGGFALGNNLFDVLLVAAFGVLGFVMQRFGYSMAAFILGLVMGIMVERNFVASMIKANGNFLSFIERPVALGLACLVLLAILWPLAKFILRFRQRKTA